MNRAVWPAPSPTQRARFCGNGAREALCRKPVADGYNPVGLCADCLSRYPARYASGGVVLHFDPHRVLVADAVAAPQARPREQAGHARVIALPAHEPCGIDGCGLLDAAGVATCAERHSFERCGCERHHDTPTRGNRGCTRCLGMGAVLVGTEPGCGTTFAVCGGCGLRERVNGGACRGCEKGRAA